MPRATIPARSVLIVSIAVLTACHDAASTAPSVAVAPVPGHVQVASGMGQRAPAGTALALPVRVQVTDPQGAPIAGQPVTFTVTAGGGALAGTATAGAIALDVPATVATNLVIDIHYVGTVDAAVKTAIETAVSRLTAIITDGYTPVAISGFDVEAGCGVPGAGTLTGTVSGIALYVSERTIDFDKGILAYANL